MTTNEIPRKRKRGNTPSQYPPEYRDLFLLLADMQTEITVRHWSCPSPSQAFTLRARLYSYLKALRMSPETIHQDTAKIIEQTYSFRVDGSDLVIWPKSQNADAIAIVGLLESIQQERAGPMIPEAAAPAGMSGGFPDPYGALSPDTSPEPQDVDPSHDPSPDAHVEPFNPLSLYTPGLPSPPPALVHPADQWADRWLALRTERPIAAPAQLLNLLRVEMLSAGHDPREIPELVFLSTGFKPSADER